MNKEFTRMLKLAGLMTEGLYTSDEKAPMEAMSHDGESKMKKSELKERIKEMMLSEKTPEERAYEEVGSLDEDYTMDAYQIAREMVRKMPFPDAVFASKDLFIATIDALVDELYSYAEDQFSDGGSAPDEGDRYDDSRDVYDDEYPDMAEGDLFEAKEDEESDTEDVIVAEPGDEEVPAEGGEDAAVDVTADDTQVDVNMDGVPDVDTGSAESKKAFTSLVDTYNASKELGDPKLTQMIANALTYYNKNIILKAGQPQA
jgi:hypothetical protein